MHRMLVKEMIEEDMKEAKKEVKKRARVPKKETTTRIRRFEKEKSYKKEQKK